MHLPGKHFVQLEFKLFLGKYPCTLDKRNRFLAPPIFREQFPGGLYITQGFDRNLLVFRTSAFNEIYQRVTSLNITDPLSRLLLRLILGTAHELEMDGHGHVIVPDDLKGFASLANDILLIGQGDYFEIWAPESWAHQEVELSDAATNANRFSALMVATR